MGRLPRGGIPGTLDHRLRGTAQSQYFIGTGDCCQRVSQFVSQHSEELVFAPVRRRQLPDTFPQLAFQSGGIAVG